MLLSVIHNRATLQETKVWPEDSKDCYDSIPSQTMRMSAEIIGPLPK